LSCAVHNITGCSSLIPLVLLATVSFVLNCRCASCFVPTLHVTWRQLQNITPCSHYSTASPDTQNTQKDVNFQSAHTFSPSRVWGGAPAKIEFGAFSLEIWQLVATILMILLRIKWPNFVQFSIQLDVLGNGLLWYFVKCRLYSIINTNVQGRLKSGQIIVRFSIIFLTGQIAKKQDCPVKNRTPGNPSADW